MRLLVATPSKWRPHNIARVWGAMQATCRGDTDLIVGLDTDDETRRAYPAGPIYAVRDGLQRHVTAWINELVMSRLSEYDAVGHFGDDCVPRTEGWDVRIMAALGKTPLAFGNDLSATDKGNLPTHVFMRSAVARKLGYFAPPVFRHMWVDFAWLAWGDAAGITYLPEVVIEHMHFGEGKSGKDASNELSREYVQPDLDVLHRYVGGRLAKDVARISRRRKPYTAHDFYKLVEKRHLHIPRP